MQKFIRVRRVKGNKMKINNMPIYMFDELVNESSMDVMENFLGNNGFIRNEFSSEDKNNQKHLHFKIEFDKSIYESTRYAQVTKHKAKELFYDIVLDRAYINATAHGDQTFIHTDNGGELGVSIMTYLGIEDDWNPNWGGETMFYNEQLEPELAVLPKKGKIIIFDSRINHVGKPPNKILFNSRYSLVAKYMRVDNV